MFVLIMQEFAAKFQKFSGEVGNVFYGSGVSWICSYGKKVGQLSLFFGNIAPLGSRGPSGVVFGLAP